MDFTILFWGLQNHTTMASRVQPLPDRVASCSPSAAAAIGLPPWPPGMQRQGLIGAEPRLASPWQRQFRGMDWCKPVEIGIGTKLLVAGEQLEGKPCQNLWEASTLTHKRSSNLESCVNLSPAPWNNWNPRHLGVAHTSQVRRHLAGRSEAWLAGPGPGRVMWQERIHGSAYMDSCPTCPFPPRLTCHVSGNIVQHQRKWVQMAANHWEFLKRTLEKLLTCSKSLSVQL